MITREALRVLEANLSFTRQVHRTYDARVNLFAEWLRQPRGQWQDWLAQRVSEYPHELQEAVRQEAVSHQQAWSRDQERGRQADAISRWRREQETAELAQRVRKAAEELRRNQQAAEAAQREREREEAVRRREEYSRIALEANRRRQEEAAANALKEARAWQALEKDGAVWQGMVSENWPYEMQPDCTGETYELGMIEDEVMA